MKTETKWGFCKYYIIKTVYFFLFKKFLLHSISLYIQESIL